MRDQLSSGWQEIVLDNKFHCLKQIIFLKVPKYFDNALTAYLLTMIKLRNDIFNIETLRLDHWFHTQLSEYKSISFKCQIKKYLRI
jgi:hypothetical protein